jgi:hypothetical protein
MCTVTYLPKRDGGFVLTHNRDEAPGRSTRHLTRDKDLVFPRDGGAGGTWIGAHRNGLTACVLNGAFVKHRHEPPYRRSRGLVLLDFLASHNPFSWWETCDLAGIEPFTLLFFTGTTIGEARWDGAQKHLRLPNPAEVHFWCSSTLYPPDMQQRRETVFRRWLDALGHRPGPAEVWRLHHEGSVGDPENDYVMNRDNRVRTVCIAQVVFGKKQVRFLYEELLHGARDEKRLLLKSS